MQNNHQENKLLQAIASILTTVLAASLIYFGSQITEQKSNLARLEVQIIELKTSLQEVRADMKFIREHDTEQQERIKSLEERAKTTK